MSDNVSRGRLRAPRGPIANTLMRFARTLIERLADRRHFWLIATPVTGVVILIALWATLVVRLNIEERQLLQSINTTADMLSRSLKQHVVKNIHDADLIARLVKYEYEKSPQSFSLKRAVDAGVLTPATQVQVTILDKDGLAIDNTAGITVRQYFADRPHFAVHRNSKVVGLYISKPVLGRISGKWTVQLTRRLDNPDGSFAGVVVVSEDPGYLTSGFYSPAVLGKDGVVAVLSDDGFLLSRRVGTNAGSPEGPPAAIYSFLKSSPSDPVVDPIDNQTRIMAYKHLRDYPLAVVAGLGKDEQFANFEKMRRTYYTMAASISAIITLFFTIVVLMLNSLFRTKNEVRALSETDSLTKLPNRDSMTNILRAKLAGGQLVGKLALLFIDLNDFKRINDTIGHDAGDQTLVQIANRLTERVGPACMVSRFSGDEFIVIHESEHLQQTLPAVIKDVVDTLDTALTIRGNPYVMHGSIGVAVHASAEESEYDLIKHADLAMYEAKEHREPHQCSTYRLHTADLSARLIDRMEFDQALHRAIREHELFLDYQPIYHLKSNAIQGYEALVRWRHPTKGVLLPAQFIPLAESTGLIAEITDYVLDAVCHQLSLWQAAVDNLPYVSVNVSTIPLMDGGVERSVRRLIADYEIPPSRLCLEITASAAGTDFDALQSGIEAVRELGTLLALDNFGVGYSSLANLSRLGLDILKIDSSFTAQLERDMASTATVESMVRLADALSLNVVMKGVETAEQANWIKRFPNISVQGRFFAEPSAAPEIPPNTVTGT